MKVIFIFLPLLIATTALGYTPDISDCHGSKQDIENANRTQEIKIKCDLGDYYFETCARLSNSVGDVTGSNWFMNIANEAYSAKVNGSCE
ncbi:MAG: hypothetical protein ACXVCY_00690 [Pseudobdellovibrionaceae bacterium]